MGVGAMGVARAVVPARGLGRTRGGFVAPPPLSSLPPSPRVHSIRCSRSSARAIHARKRTCVTAAAAGAGAVGDSAKDAAAAGEEETAITVETSAAVAEEDEEDEDVDAKMAAMQLLITAMSWTIIIVQFPDVFAKVASKVGPRAANVVMTVPLLVIGYRGGVDKSAAFLKSRLHRLFHLVKFVSLKTHAIECLVTLVGYLGTAALWFNILRLLVMGLIPSDFVFTIPPQFAFLLDPGASCTGAEAQAAILLCARKATAALAALGLGRFFMQLKSPTPDVELSVEKGGILHQHLQATMGRLPPETESRRFAGVSLLLNRVIDLAIVLGVARVALAVVGVNLRGILAVAGVGALAVSFAARPLVQNLIAGLSIFLTNPFTLNDEIVTGSIKQGRVQNIGWVSTTILTEDGPVFMPNDSLASAQLVNKSRWQTTGSLYPRILTLVPKVPGEEDVVAATAALDAILRARPEVQPSTVPMVNFLGTTDAGALRFLLKINIKPVSAKPLADERLSDVLTALYSEASRNGLTAPAAVN